MASSVPYIDTGLVWQGQNPIWTPGSGLSRSHSGMADDYKKYVLDKDRDWKTKYSFQIGARPWTHEWGTEGDPTKKNRAAYTTGKWFLGDRGYVKNRRHDTHHLYGMALEQLDWKAYDRDAQYKAALTGVRGDEGFGKGFQTIQDILDAEAYMQGTWRNPEEEDEATILPIDEPREDAFGGFDFESHRSEFQDQIDSLTERLESFDPGPVPDLDSQLNQMRDEITQHLSDTYQGNLEDFQSSDWIDSYVNRQGFASADEMAAQGNLTQQQIAALRDTLSGDISNQGADISLLQQDLRGVGGQVRDLSDRWSGVSTDVAVLREQLANQTGNLQNLEGTFDDRISDLNTALQGWQGDFTADRDDWRTTVQDQFANIGTSTDQAIANVRGDLGLDLEQATLDLRNELGQNLSRLGAERDIAIGGLRNELGADLNRVSRDLGDRFGQATEDIRGELGQATAGLRGELGETATGLRGEQQAATAGLRSELGQATEGLRGEQQAATAGLRGELGQATEGLRGEQQAATAALRGELGTQSDRITQVGSELLNTASGLQSNIDASRKQLEDRLTKLSGQFNYRMLGDSAVGVQTRKSRARKSGDAAFGTGQLNRSMQISALNL